MVFSDAFKKLESGEAQKIKSAGGITIKLMETTGKRYLVLNEVAILLDEIQGGNWEVVDDA